MTAEADLLAPLQPPEDVERPIGEIRLAGNGQAVPEGFGAGVEMWCGVRGWRPFGEILGASLAWHRGRLLGSVTFDLGAAPMRPPAGEPASEDEEIP